MDTIYEPLIKFFYDPLCDLFQILGMNESLAKVLSAAIIALLIWQLGVWFNRLLKRLRNNKTAKDLKPEFDYLTIKGLRDIFIPTRYARISPNRYDNPHEAHKHNEPRKLIPFMAKKSFNERVENEKFYLILGDSGMGKTAFMVNLYMAYHSAFNFHRKQKMKLFRFQPPDVENPIDIVNRINIIPDEEAKNTILLLDGLDEDPFILSKDPNVSDDEAFVKRLDNIVSSTMRFCDVVFTCRTQYFPQQELQDYELNIRKPDNRGFFKLNKYYLFPFSDLEVKKYLNKKYGRLKFWNWSNKRKAIQLVENSHKLMSRPMLLSYLDDLVTDDKKYQFSYQIYETLIEKWLIRESEKWKKSDQQKQFKITLRKLARETGLQIYKNWLSQGWLYLSKDDILQIAQIYNIELKPDEVKGKSLLTCDPLLNWKFAHKSILEYFLAKECVNNWEFAAAFKFSGMDMAKHFYLEMEPDFNAINFIKVDGGKFMMGDEHSDLLKYSLPVHEVTVSDFYISKTPITQKQWRDIMDNNPSRFKKDENCPVERVSWNDVQVFIKKLSNKTGKNFRLPTEAEWEYATRGGHQAPLDSDVHIGRFRYAGSDNLDEVGWYNGNSNKKTHPVTTKKPNELGIYDMCGNVWEWCQDKWHENYEGAPRDGSAWETGKSSDRVMRGGSWYYNARYCRSAFRYGRDPGDRYRGIGFRLVFVPQSVGG